MLDNRNRPLVAILKMLLMQKKVLNRDAEVFPSTNEWKSQNVHHNDVKTLQ